MDLLNFLSKKDTKEAVVRPAPPTPGARPAGTRGKGTDFSKFPFNTFFRCFEIGTPVHYSVDKDMSVKYETLCMAVQVENHIIDTKKNLITDDDGNFSIKIAGKLMKVPKEKLNRFSILIPDTTKDSALPQHVKFDIGRKLFVKDMTKPASSAMEVVVEKAFIVPSGNFTNIDAIELRPVGFSEAVESDVRRAKRVYARIPVKVQVPGSTEKALASAIIADFNETGIKMSYSPTMKSLATLCTNAIVGIYITRPAGAHSAHPEVLRYKGKVIWNKKHESFGVKLSHIYRDKTFQVMQPIDGIVLKGFLVNHPMCQAE